MKTLAAVSHSPRSAFAIETIELPEPGPRDVLVRIVAAGICHTDLASRDGLLGAPFPSVFGHEGAGVVEAVGEVTKVAPGDHVVLAPDFDGTCPQCQRGAPMYCDRFAELNFQRDPHVRTAALADGRGVHLKYFGQSSFARHALAGARNTVRVAAEVPLELLGPLGCGIQTGAGTVMNGLCAETGSSIVVLGTGAVGLAAVLGAVVRGCATIIAVDRVESRLELARSLGATHAVNTALEANPHRAIRTVLPRGADYVVDCAGSPELMASAFKALARLGTLGLVALPPAAESKLEVPWYPMIANGGYRVQGFVEGNSVPDVFIPQLVELFRAGRFPFDRLIRKYPFERINEAVEDALAGRTIKAVLTM